MLSILYFYKNNKQDIYKQYDKPIYNLLYSTELLSLATAKIHRSNHFQLKNNFQINLYINIIKMLINHL